jgi:hypothetical protein
VLIQLAIDDDKGLGLSGNTPCFSSFFGEFFPIQPGEVLIAPVPQKGREVVNLHHLGLVRLTTHPGKYRTIT